MKRTTHALRVIKPHANLQKGMGVCLNFAHFSMQFYNPDDPKGGPWHNAPVRQKLFWGMHPLDRHLPVLIKLQIIQKQNRHSSINAKLFIFLLWLVIHNCILLATVFIIEIPILNFAHIFSGVSYRQPCPAVMLAVIMVS